MNTHHDHGNLTLIHIIALPGFTGPLDLIAPHGSDNTTDDVPIPPDHTIADPHDPQPVAPHRSFILDWTPGTLDGVNLNRDSRSASF